MLNVLYAFHAAFEPRPPHAMAILQGFRRDSSGIGVQIVGEESIRKSSCWIRTHRPPRPRRWLYARVG